MSETTSSVPVAEVPKPRFRLDNRYIAPLLITLFLLVGHLSYGILESYWKTGLAIVTALVVELILGRIFFGKWMNLASAYITGISVGILVRSPAFWPYALCSAISIMSKYVLRLKGRHLWNPSNFGLSVFFFLAAETMAGLSIQWGNSSRLCYSSGYSVRSSSGGRSVFILVRRMSFRFSSSRFCGAGSQAIHGNLKSRR